MVEILVVEEIKIPGIDDKFEKYFDKYKKNLEEILLKYEDKRLEIKSEDKFFDEFENITKDYNSSFFDMYNELFDVLEELEQLEENDLTKSYSEKIKKEFLEYIKNLLEKYKEKCYLFGNLQYVDRYQQLTILLENTQDIKGRVDLIFPNQKDDDKEKVIELLIKSRCMLYLNNEELLKNIFNVDELELINKYIIVK